jgi:hypothetical protein
MGTHVEGSRRIGTTPNENRCPMEERVMVRNGKHAVIAIIAFSALAVVLVYLASLRVTEPDGTIDPKESVVDPS